MENNKAKNLRFLHPVKQTNTGQSTTYRGNKQDPKVGTGESDTMVIVERRNMREIGGAGRRTRMKAKMFSVITTAQGAVTLKLEKRLQ